MLALVFLPALADVVHGSGGGNVAIATLLAKLAITFGKIVLFILLALVGGKWLASAHSRTYGDASTSGVLDAAHIDTAMKRGRFRDPFAVKRRQSFVAG